MAIENLLKATQAIAGGIEKRYRQRVDVRSLRLAEVDAKGALGAAPRIEALGRASHLTPLEARNLEATSGNYDIDQINFLSRGLKAARPVCRLVNSGTSWGTGFVVAPGLLLTNQHVLETLEDASVCLAEFGYEYDAQDQPLQRVLVSLAPQRVFISSHSDHLDFTLVAFDDPNGVVAPFGWLPLDPRENKIVEGEPAISISHPGQEDKKICLFESTLVDRLKDDTQPYLHYTTDTEKGGSGSPIFNRNWQVIGLHHGNVALLDKDAAGHDKTVVVNEGIRISRIVKALTSGANISHGSPEQRTVALDLLQRPSTLLNSRPQGPSLVTVPFLSDPAAASVARDKGPGFVAEGGRRTTIKIPSLAHYRGRLGYDEAFLGEGMEVPLPKLAPAMLDDVAPLLKSNTSYVLKYTHYSVVMCGSRRTAYFSACNLDGSTNPEAFDRKRRLQLETARERLELEKAADQWYYDPRMALEYQPGPDLFDDAATKFDFGHITRRMDAVWGATEQEKLMGSDDTFHMTNCAVQQSSYNQHGDWGSLEDAVAQFARGKDGTPRRVNVVSGPVLHPSDTELLGMQVPSAFWKVVSFEEGGELRAFAFLTTQQELVEAEARKLESTKELARKAFTNEWLSTVRDVSRLTSLDFGPLLAADYFAAAGGKKVRVTAALLDQMFG